MGIVTLKIKIITKLLIALTAMLTLLQNQSQVLGAITTTLSIPAITIPQTATSSLDVVASSLNVIPIVSINKNTISFSAMGTYDNCQVEVNQYNPLTFNTGYTQDVFNLSSITINKVYFSGTYPFILRCAMKNKQVGFYKGSFLIP